MGRGTGQSATTAAASRSNQESATAAKLEEYKRELRGLTNLALVDRAASEINAAAILGSRGRIADWADDCADAVHDECDRRGNPDLYKRGYNQVCRMHGYEGATNKISLPVDLGDLTPAVGAPGGIFHLSEDQKTTLCKLDLGSDGSYRPRDEINESFLCQGCVEVEEKRFAELRQENLPDWHPLRNQG